MRRRAAKFPGQPEEKGLKKATFNAENIEALLQHYGADRILDAIGKFRGSEGAIRSLGLIAETRSRRAEPRPFTTWRRH